MGAFYKSIFYDNDNNNVFYKEYFLKAYFSKVCFPKCDFLKTCFPKAYFPKAYFVLFKSIFSEGAFSESVFSISVFFLIPKVHFSDIAFCISFISELPHLLSFCELSVCFPSDCQFFFTYCTIG